jgi:cell division protein FtsB
MVTNYTKEVTDLKNDNTLLKQEIKNLHSPIEASPRTTSQYINREQRIVPAEMSHKEAASL